MLDLSDEIKNIYRSDNNTGLISFTIGDTQYTASDYLSGSITMIESLCSKDTLDYSSVEANEFDITIAQEKGNVKDLTGQTLVAVQTVNGVEVPLGTYTIDTVEFDGDYYTKIKAYDDMKKFNDTDISDWFNSELTFPITVRNLLIALCNKCGVSHELPSTFTNSAYEITQNAYMSDYSGGDLLGDIQNMCGLFFHVNRYGKLVIVDTTATENIEYTALMEDATISDSTTPSIDSVQIRASDTDIGVITSSTGKNTYIIQNNILLDGFDDDTKKEIALNILANIGSKEYTPFSAKMKARVFLECGDTVTVTSYKGESATAMITYRTLSDVNLIVDSIEVKGKSDSVTPTQSSKTTLKTLKRSMHEFTNDINELSSTIKTYETTFNNKIEGLQTQIDGNIETYFEDYAPSDSTYPTNEWTTKTEKDKHLGDLFYDNSTGYSYRYTQDSQGYYKWIKLSDSDITKALEEAQKAESLANTKRRIFYQTPTAPYDEGDLWCQGEDGDILLCTTSREAEFHESDWEKKNKYTDDTLAKTVQEDLANNYMSTTEITSKLEQMEDSVTASVEEKVDGKYLVRYGLQPHVGLRPHVGLQPTLSAQGMKTVIETTRNRVSKLEINVDSIVSTVAETYETKTDAETKVSTLQSSIKQNADNIALKVSSTDYNGTTIASLINQSASTVTILASHIKLEGAVTANGNFKIDTSGNLTATNATFSGTITGSKISGSTIESVNPSNSDHKLYLNNGQLYSTNANGYLGFNLNERTANFYSSVTSGKLIGKIGGMSYPYITSSTDKQFAVSSAYNQPLMLGMLSPNGNYAYEAVTISNGLSSFGLVYNPSDDPNSETTLTASILSANYNTKQVVLSNHFTNYGSSIYLKDDKIQMSQLFDIYLTGYAVQGRTTDHKYSIHWDGSTLYCIVDSTWFRINN